jgi:hypothetical protein
MRTGTPKSFQEAISRGGTNYILVEHNIRDLLAQRFTEALIKAKTEQEEEAIKALWTTITAQFGDYCRQKAM